MSKVEISKKLVLVNSASTAAAKLIDITCIVWVTQYLLNMLPRGEFDIYVVVQSVMTFVPLLTVVLQAGLGRFVVEAYAKDDEHRVTEIVSTMFPVVLVAGALLLVVGGVMSWNISSVITIRGSSQAEIQGRLWEMQLMLMLLITTASVKIVMSPFQLGLYVRQRFVLQNLINVGCSVLNQSLLLVLLLGVSTRIIWVVVAMTVTSMVNVAVTTILSRRFVPALRFRPSAFRLRGVVHLITFNIWSLVRQLADVIQTGLMQLLLNNLGRMGDPTTYNVGNLPGSKIGEFSFGWGTALEPAMTAMHATGKQEQLGNTYLRGGRYRLWTTLFFATPLCVFAFEFIDLYAPQKYPGLAPVMLLLLLTFPITAGNAMVGELCVAKGRLGRLSKIMLFQNVLSLGLMLVLVWGAQMGALGAAIATTAVTAVIHPALWWRLGLDMADVRFVRWLRETMLPGLLPAAAAAAVLIPLRLAVRPHTWLSLGLCAAAGCLVYVVVALRFAFQPCDRQDFAAGIGAIKRRLRRPSQAGGQ